MLKLKINTFRYLAVKLRYHIRGNVAKNFEIVSNLPLIIMRYQYVPYSNNIIISVICYIPNLYAVEAGKNVEPSVGRT